MIARSEVERNPAVGLKQAPHVLPLGLGRGVVQPLNGIAGGQHEGRLGGGQIPPDAFIDTRLGFARAVAEQYEMEVVRRRGAEGQPCRRHHGDERGQNAAHHCSPAGAATKR